MSAQAIVWIARDLDYMLLVRRCFRQSGVDNPIVLLTSGELGLSFIRIGDGQETTPSLPLLIVTEVALPQMDGYELLRSVKTEPRFAAVPILLLSTAQPDIHQTSEFNSVHFLRKPGVEGIPTLVNAIIERWIPRR